MSSNQTLKMEIKMSAGLQIWGICLNVYLLVCKEYIKPTGQSHLHGEK